MHPDKVTNLVSRFTGVPIENLKKCMDFNVFCILNDSGNSDQNNTIDKTILQKIQDCWDQAVSMLLQSRYTHETCYRPNVDCKLIEKARECHDHKPQQVTDTKWKRGRMEINTSKINTQMHEKHIDKLSLPQAR